jgi:putative Ca2+/H+ antiporter (TMEM165/GDT1 family)
MTITQGLALGLLIVSTLTMVVGSLIAWRNDAPWLGMYSGLVGCSLAIVAAWIVR